MGQSVARSPGRRPSPRAGFSYAKSTCTWTPRCEQDDAAGLAEREERGALVGRQLGVGRRLGAGGDVALLERERLGVQRRRGDLGVGAELLAPFERHEAHERVVGRPVAGGIGVQDGRLAEQLVVAQAPDLHDVAVRDRQGLVAAQLVEAPAEPADARLGLGLAVDDEDVGAVLEARVDGDVEDRGRARATMRGPPLRERGPSPPSTRPPRASRSALGP